jgi:hypothetical protein
LKASQKKYLYFSSSFLYALLALLMIAAKSKRGFLQQVDITAQIMAKILPGILISCKGFA